MKAKRLKRTVSCLLLVAAAMQLPAQQTDAVTRFEEIKAKAEKGDAQAQVDLGDCYRKGEGVVKYEVEACKWDLLAAAQGDTKAKRNASLLELMRSREELAEGKRRAQDWLEQRKKSSSDNR